MSIVDKDKIVMCATKDGFNVCNLPYGKYIVEVSDAKDAYIHEIHELACGKSFFIPDGVKDICVDFYDHEKVIIEYKKRAGYGAKRIEIKPV